MTGQEVPLVSIIIPAYNAAGTIALCLEGCLRQDYPATEVIVVDDGSTDGTGDRARELDGVRVIRQANAGPAAARNRGAAEARGVILAYTDADCVPRADWVTRLAEGFAEGVGAVGGTYGIANPECLLARLIHQEIRMRHARFGEDVDFLGSFNVAYRAEAFEVVQGFDTAYRAASGEDNDLSYRLRGRGFRLRFVPGAVVDHFHPVALEPYLLAQMRHGYWRMKLYARHPRRARTGDDYAGRAALWAPPVAVALLALFVFTFAVGWWLPFEVFAASNQVFLASYILFFLAHLPLALRVTEGWKTLDTPYFVLVSTCRAFARGLGLLGGAWRFQVRGKN